MTTKPTLHQAHRELDRLVTRAIAEERRKLREHLDKEPCGILTTASAHWRATRTRREKRVVHLLAVRARLSEMAEAALFAERVAGPLPRGRRS